MSRATAPRGGIGQRENRRYAHGRGELPWGSLEMSSGAWGESCHLNLAARPINAQAIGVQIARAVKKNQYGKTSEVTAKIPRQGCFRARRRAASPRCRQISGGRCFLGGGPYRREKVRPGRRTARLPKISNWVPTIGRFGKRGGRCDLPAGAQGHKPAVAMDLRWSGVTLMSDAIRAHAREVRGQIEHALDEDSSKPADAGGFRRRASCYASLLMGGGKGMMGPLIARQYRP